MRSFVKSMVAAVCMTFIFASVAYADNPIVQHMYTADPAPLVYQDTVYLYTGHDEDGATYFEMNEWRVFSSKDMVNWTDHGSPLSTNTFSWSSGEAWAGQAIERNGKFYWYVTAKDRALGRHVIGVAVADSPTGPFKDALGRPLVAAHWGDIDPTVFIDDDGQAYMYWGNNNLWYVKLNPDMISYSGSIVQVPLTTAAFGPDYEEGPWLHKRNGIYYLLYAAGGVPEHLAYSTSTSPTGPWVYRGVIMPTQGRSFTNHPGVIDFKGNSYLFYHNGALPGGGGFTRSVAIEPFRYNADGTIPLMNMTTAGVVTGVGNLNPYVRTEAETMAWGQGIKTEPSSQGGMNIGFIENGDYIKVEGVQFGTGAASFEASVSSASNGGRIELRLDSRTGPLIGTLQVQGTGGWQSWQTQSTTVSGAAGIHDLYLVFTGGSGYLFNVDWWMFKANTAAPPVMNGAVYTLQNAHSNKLLGIEGMSSNNGAKVVQAEGNSVANRWRFDLLSNGYYKLTNMHSGKVLGIESMSTANGAKALQWEDNGTADHEWKLVPSVNGSYKLENRHSGKVLGVEGMSTATGAVAVQWEDNGTADHNWTFSGVN